MGLTFFAPSTKVKDANSKDAVVSILSSQWPLSVPQILSSVKKNYALDISYQAVHKTLRELSGENIVVREGKNYLLSSDWIKQLKNFSNSLEKNYLLKKNSLFDIAPMQTINLKLDTISEVDDFLFQLFELHKSSEKEIVIAHWHHLWWPLFYSGEEYQELKSIARSSKGFIVCNGNTLIDKWCADFYKKLGFKVKTNALYNQSNDLFVYKDVVVSIYYPLDIQKKINSAYSSYKKIEDIPLADFFHKVFEHKSGLHLTVNRNKQLSEQLKEQTIALFK